MSSVQENGSVHVVYTNGFDIQNNLLSYYGLVDARISASEKYLPVLLNAN